MWNKITKLIEYLNEEFEFKATQKDSRDEAKNRLKLVLMHDRNQLAPGVMDQMRNEIVEVISKYVEIDNDALDLRFEKEETTMAIIANIPVVKTKSNALAS